MSVATALIQGDVLTTAKDDHSVSLPIETAADMAAETIRHLLDEDDIKNCQKLIWVPRLGKDPNCCDARATSSAKATSNSTASPRATSASALRKLVALMPGAPGGDETAAKMSADSPRA